MFKTQKNIKWQRAFSLIELLVVIAIIGILSAGGGVYYSQAQKQSRDLRRQSDLAAIQSALELYYSDNKAYPDSLTVLETDDYLSKLPKDLNNESYGYQKPPAATAAGCEDIYALYAKAEISKNANVGNEKCSPVTGNYIVLTGGK